jgi:hypothetical protein
LCCSGRGCSAPDRPGRVGAEADLDVADIGDDKEGVSVEFAGELVIEPGSSA